MRGATGVKCAGQTIPQISIHAPRAGGDTSPRPEAPNGTFQSTPPVRGATHVIRAVYFSKYISIHAPRAGGDCRHALRRRGLYHFNPRPPCGERRITFLVCCANCCNFNPRSPCGERRKKQSGKKIQTIFQSTLPVRGATISSLLNSRSSYYFNPRSPCGERRLNVQNIHISFLFQSTLPVRGATRDGGFDEGFYGNFNPRSPCGERRGAGRRIRGNRLISIHAPRAGSDIQKLAFLSDSLGFQSTLPVRGATQRQKNRWELFYISIHAPRAGSDDEPRAGRGVPRDFNPRSPCGERREFGQYATAASQQISIHAPRAGSDYAAGDYRYNAPGFQSTLPVRGAT